MEKMLIQNKKQIKCDDISINTLRGMVHQGWEREEKNRIRALKIDPQRGKLIYEGRKTYLKNYSKGPKLSKFPSFVCLMNSLFQMISQPANERQSSPPSTSAPLIIFH
jgi:hypothetical protein